jgi:hypothetical protein
MRRFYRSRKFSLPLDHKRRIKDELGRTAANPGSPSTPTIAAPATRSTTSTERPWPSWVLGWRSRSAATGSPSRASTACRLTASGIARRCGRSSRCPRDRPRLLQDGRGTFAGPRSSKPAAPPTGSPTPETPAQQADSRWQSPHPWISTGTTTPPITGGWSTSPHATTGDVLDVDCGEQSRVEAFLRGQSRSGRTLIC